MSRLDKERQELLEPQRMEVAKLAIQKLGLTIHYIDDKRISFMYGGKQVSYWPYSGWHTGKSIKDGRGLQNLLKQLK